MRALSVGNESGHGEQRGGAWRAVWARRHLRRGEAENRSDFREGARSGRYRRASGAADGAETPSAIRYYSRRLRIAWDSMSMAVTAMTMMMTMAETALKSKAFIRSNSTWPMPPAPIRPSTVAERLLDSKR